MQRGAGVGLGERLRHLGLPPGCFPVRHGAGSHAPAFGTAPLTLCLPRSQRLLRLDRCE